MNGVGKRLKFMKVGLELAPCREFIEMLVVEKVK